MLRWCSTTFRILDGRGFSYSPNARRCSTRVQITPIAIKETHVKTHIQETVQSPVTYSSNTSYFNEHSNLQREALSFSPTRHSGLESSSPPNFNAKAYESFVHQNNGNTTRSTTLPPVAEVETNAALSAIDDLLCPQASIRDLSIFTLISLYDDSSAKTLNLGHSRLEAIISLCGTLASAPNRSTFDSALKSHFHKILDREKSALWSFILKLVDGLETSKLALSIQSRYWIMKAYLEGVGLREPHSGVAHARAQYQLISALSNEPDAHLPFLHFLITSRVPEYTEEGFDHLCDLLRRVPDPHPRFADFFWEMLLSNGSALSSSCKENVLQTICARIAMRSRNMKPTSAQNPTSTWVIQVSHLKTAFAAFLFPSYDTEQIPRYLTQWVDKQVHQAFAADFPVDVRWSNLIFLAASLSPQSISVEFGSLSTTTPSNPEPEHVLWRTAATLHTLDTIILHDPSELVKGITRPLMKIFANTELSDHPINVTRAFISTFFRIAVKSHDHQLAKDALNLSNKLGLWQNQKSSTPQSQAQIIDCIAMYAKASVTFAGHDWPALYSFLSCILPESNWQLYLTESLLRYYMKQDIALAYDLYVHSLETSIGVRPHIVQHLLRAIVHKRRWDIATIFLEHPSTTREHIELIFGQSLRSFQVRQVEYEDPAYVHLLSKTAYKLYSMHRLPTDLKYPTCFFFSLMIRTQKTNDAVDFVKMMHDKVPDLFTPRLVRRLVLLVLSSNDFRNAVELFRTFYSVEDKCHIPTMEPLRRRLQRSLARRGADKLMRRVPEKRIRLNSFVQRENLIDSLRRHRPSDQLARNQYLREFISHAGNDASAVREAVSVLVRAKRFYIARKIFVKAHSNLDEKSKTLIGNILIHGPMVDEEFRNGRLVRHILSIKNYLIQECGFVPDRTTINILLKAILKWRTGIDAPRVRALFDKMVRDGYPVPERFCRKHGVPFESPPNSIDFSIPKLSTYISFYKHTRPLYKMFIKSFYLRDDVVAAKTVVGILREVEITDMQEREKRNRARREGVLRKKRVTTSGIPNRHILSNESDIQN